MAHPRKIIRDAVVQALTGLAATTTHVHATRTQPLEAEQLPALCIYTLDETSELDALSPRKMMRQLTLIVEAVAQVNDTIDDALDQICLEVETQLGTNFTLGGLVKDCRLASTKIAVRGQGEKDTGSAVMSFDILYRTLAADASLIS